MEVPRRIEAEPPVPDLLEAGLQSESRPQCGLPVMPSSSRITPWKGPYPKKMIQDTEMNTAR